MRSYVICKHTNADDLEIEVNALIESGSMPVGAMQIIPKADSQTGEYMCYQSMYKAPAKKPAKPMSSKKHEYSTVWIDRVWHVYPKRSGSNPKNRAYSAWEARVSEGEGFAEMFAGLQRYIHFCAATDILGTCYVMQAATFFGPDKHYEESWTIPKMKPSEDPDKQYHKTFDPDAKVVIPDGVNPWEGM